MIAADLNALVATSPHPAPLKWEPYAGQLYAGGVFQAEVAGSSECGAEAEAIGEHIARSDPRLRYAIESEGQPDARRYWLVVGKADCRRDRRGTCSGTTPPVATTPDGQFQPAERRRR